MSLMCISSLDRDPFQGKRYVVLYLPETEEANLAIFNIQGQLVRQLDKGLLKQGHYQTPWDRTNQAGTKVPSGVYLIQLRMKDQLINKRVVLQQ